MDRMTRIGGRFNRLGFASPPPPPERRRKTVSLMKARCSYSSSNNYAVLGLTPFASKDEVKNAYRRLALKYHPDVVRGGNSADRNETFLEIKSAYENLMEKFGEEEEEEEEEVTIRRKPKYSSYDEWDDWDEWKGCEGGFPYHAY